MENILTFKKCGMALILTSVVHCSFNGEKVSMKWSEAKNSITEKCAKAQAELEIQLKNIEAIQEPTFENSVKSFDSALTNFSKTLNFMELCSSVSTDQVLRDQAKECSEKSSKFLVSVFTRKILYEKIKKGSEKGLNTPEDKMLSSEMLEDFKQSGIELSDAKKEKLKKIENEIIELGSKFDKTLNEWNVTLDFTKKELEWLPETLLATLEHSKKPGKDYVLTLHYPHVMPAMQYVKDAEVRKEIHIAFNQKGGKENAHRLAKTLQLRFKKAKLLGFKNHAEYVLTRKMAKNPYTVKKFLSQVRKAVSSKAKQDLKELAEAKRDYLKLSKTPKLYAWDIDFYKNIIVETKYKLDENKVKEYFPLETVTKGMFSIYQKLLGVTFVELKDADVWHPDVKSYAIKDNKTNQTIAGFYMDLFPRDGKYGHAAAFTIAPGYLKTTGDYSAPISSIVANFTSPTKDAPSLLTHGEVETLFHEFGHIMHQTLTKARYGSLSGTQVKRDFVEAPSQMLENWVWNEECLKLMSGHYKTGEKLPSDMLQKMLALKKFNIGYHFLRQNYLATLDLTYHTDTSGKLLNTTEIDHKLFHKILGLKRAPNTYFEAGFGHLMGGYDAAYYGYMWSLVFAEDMFTRFDKNILSEEVGMEYRKSILEPGGTRDPHELIKEFLHREPSNEPFFSQFK